MRMTPANIGLFLNRMVLSAGVMLMYGEFRFVKPLRAFRSTGFTDDATAERVTLTDTAFTSTVPVRFPPYDTASRPSAATAEEGAAIYDTDLKKPLFSDGAVWLDANGDDPDV